MHVGRETFTVATIDLHLVRHGRTAWNQEGRLQGQRGDVPLDDLGRKQADALPERLRRLDVSAVVASDLRRTLETATPAVVRLGLPLVVDHDWREQAFGVYEGARADELRASGEDPLARGREDPDWAPVGGESRRQLYDRVRRALERLATSPPGRSVAVVSHGGPIRMAIGILAGLPVERVPRRVVENTEIISLELAPRRLR